MPKRGLPETLRMRHDAHYVETLAAPGGTPVGRMVPIEHIDPNPDQPRQAMGDLGGQHFRVTLAEDRFLTVERRADSGTP